MSLTPVDIAAGIAASRLLPVTKQFWDKLPRWLAVVLPVLVLDLPQIADAFGVAKTGADLTTALLVSVALLVPGIAEAESTTTPKAS